MIAGTYFLTITDALNCQKDTTFQVTQPNAIQITHTQQNVTCNGLSNGSIDLTVSGGNVPYSYNWTGPSCPCGNNQDLVNLQAGVYNVTVTDNLGCTATYSVTITQPSTLTVSSTQTNVSCFGGNNGSITLTVNGGTPAYSYTWSGPSCPCPNSGNITNLTAGVYNVTVSDANNCTVTTSVTITQPASALSVSSSKTDVLCFGGNNGSITLTVNGGTPAYSYTWTGPSCPCPNSPNLTNLQGGIYNVTVTDANNCTVTTSVTITQPSDIIVNPVTTNISCFGQCNGSIQLNVSGGILPYSFNWTGPSCPCTGQNLTNLCAGTYQVTITDGNSCTKSF
ncbi:MAG: SprB repeat-containing protein, partial [Bacteroidales bacterium]|nr:SprB repeat-containing protein [Bacteroidales bacterium]